MAKEIPETYKKYVIQRIINPGVYWMSKNHNGIVFKKEMREFDYLLTKNVEKIVNAEKISIGKIIAVKEEAGFQRGLVTDIFNRNSRITYLILLIDHGNMIETNEKKIYWIRNEELINKKASAIRVSIKGIQPVALDIKDDKPFLSGIFQRRVQDTWSACAYKYVQNLFEKNPCVFVKPLQTNNSNISGEIYFIQESEKGPISLGQKLCDNGFAVFSEINSRVFIESDLKDGQDLCIEEKIPNGALATELQHKDILESVNHLNKDRDSSNSITLTQLTNTYSDLDPQQSRRCRDSKTQNISLLKNTIDNKNSSFNNSLGLNSDTCNSSWILKAHFLNSFVSSSDSFKNNAFPESEETSSLILENSKVSIFGVVKRSLELYEKHKKQLRGYCHN